MQESSRAGGSRRTSLARESGQTVSLTVSALILLGHGLFAYAQASGINSDCVYGTTQNTTCENGDDSYNVAAGGLMKGVISAHLDMEPRRLVGTAAHIVDDMLCAPHGMLMDCPNGDSTTVSIPLAAEADACRVLQCGGVTLEITEIHISYWYSIKEMWEQDAANLISNSTGQYPARPASFALFAFSFVWPHVKLLLMHIFFYVPLLSGTRRNGNYWLAFFGKWSLSDALTMCCIIGLFNLTVNMDLIQIWSTFKALLQTLCTEECPKIFQNMTGCNATCALLEKTIDELQVFSPQNFPSSDVDLHLRISGLMSMYSFCAAVIVSLCTGVLIENLDEGMRARKDAMKGQLAQSPRPKPLGSTANSLLANEQWGASQPPDRHAFLPTTSQTSHVQNTQEPPPLNQLLMPQSSLPTRRPWTHALHTLLVLTQLVLAVCALTYPLFDRKLSGGLARFLEDSGIEFDGKFSMFQLSGLAGQAGGLDLFMAGTCAVFVVGGPLLRPLTELWLLLVPMTQSNRQSLHRLSRHISIFYAFEVMLLAVPLLNLAFGPMTNQLLTPITFPPCGILMKRYPESGTSCFELDVNPEIGYWITAAAWGVYLLSGCDGSPTHKYLHSLAFPGDYTPPGGCCSS